MLLISHKNVPSIIETLKNVYGRPEYVIKALIAEIEMVQPPKEYKPDTVVKFSAAVNNLVTALKNLEKPQYLWNYNIIEDLIEMMTPSLRQKWAEHSIDVSEYSLEEFSKWLQRIGKAASVLNYPTNYMKPRAGKKFEDTFLTTVNKTCNVCHKNVHKIEECQQFKEMNVNQRWKWAKDKKACYKCLGMNHSVKNCRSKKSCQRCQKWHHSFLHKEEMKEQLPSETFQETHQVDSVAEEHHSCCFQQEETWLRVVPVIVSGTKGSREIFALFDEASTITLIDEEVAEAIGVHGPQEPLKLRWTNNLTHEEPGSSRVTIKIKGVREDRTFTMTHVRTSQSLNLPVQSIDTKKVQQWRNLTENLNRLGICSRFNVKPKLLIGQDNIDLIIAREVIETGKNAPVLSRSKLGWCLHGSINKFKGRSDYKFVLHVSRSEEKLKFFEDVRDYFSREVFGVQETTKKNTAATEDEYAMEIANQTSRRIENRWEIGLLWKKEKFDLNNSEGSRLIALRRLKSVKKRLEENKEFAALYGKKIAEYTQKGYARKLSQEEIDSQQDRIWYLPHFGVYNENKPGKIRLVFDAAARGNGKSLNDMLLRGPDLYNSLVTLLWKFRQEKIAFTADIREMFHQIRIKEEDHHAQRFLWPSSNDSKPEVYAMQVMIFGAVSSPFCAQYIKNKNAMEFQEEYPKAVDAILKKHYMDDYVDSVSSEEEAIKLVEEVIKIHKKGGFDIRNWITNCELLLKKIPEELREDPAKKVHRVLGIQWDTQEDVLKFPLSFHKVEKRILSGEKTPTKREVLQIVMSLYDPLGLLSHYSVRGKILLQQIWIEKMNWDEQIKEDIHKKFIAWIRKSEKIQKLKIPRCYNLNYDNSWKIEQHVFCDASQQAIAATSYLRFIGKEEVVVVLVMARTHVTPIKKKISIPRLELQATVIASRLARTVKENHNFPLQKTFLWSDSRVVLGWIRSEEQKTEYVQRRIQEILKNCQLFTCEWKWVPTEYNVADEATRDAGKINLEIDGRWFKGPEFLYNESRWWPKENNSDLFWRVTENMEEENLGTPVLTTMEVKLENFLPQVERFSKWSRLIRATAYVLKFIQLCRKKTSTNELTIEDLDEAEELWNMKVQMDSFNEDYQTLKRNLPLSKSSKLLQLCPTMKNRSMRVNGRLEKSQELTPEAKQPVILDGKHPYTELLVHHIHCKNGHVGRETIVSKLREKYWITQGRRTVDRISKQCNTCRYRRVKPSPPEMGQLPEFRLTKPDKAFTYVGIDYFGPYNVSIGRRREKRYGVIFTCLSIRAIHIELADSLSTDSCILAVRRFIARRGQPKLIITDNGTNLKGAAKELKESLEKIDMTKMGNYLLSEKIDWKFIPPASPHMGGTWERMVRSIKEALRHTLREQAPRTEVLQTVMVEAENMVNSRPLTYISENPQDPEVLTPNHFLLGTAPCPGSPGVFNENNDRLKKQLKKQWRFAQILCEKLWSRWMKEYLPTLLKRTKWLQSKQPVLKVGDIVIITDNNIGRNNWPMGRITKVFPGKDSKVRVVEVKTRVGTFVRSVVKICALDWL